MEKKQQHSASYLQAPYDEELITKNPWTLKGRGLILLYRFSKSAIKNCRVIPEAVRDQFQGGLGYLMLVEYTQTPVGSYQELLFIPGAIATPIGKKQTVSNIYVDSLKSVVSGRSNWGIPKDLADFDWQKNQIQVSKDGQTIFSLEYRKRWLFLPMSTSLLPIQLYQELDDKSFQVSPKGLGLGRLASIRSMTIHSDFFPDISEQKPLLSIYVEPFELIFP